MDEFVDDEQELGIDVCQHGVGFDEDCEWCDLEIAEEAAAKRAALRAARNPQTDLFTSPPPQGEKCAD